MITIKYSRDYTTFLNTGQRPDEFGKITFNQLNWKKLDTTYKYHIFNLFKNKMLHVVLPFIITHENVQSKYECTLFGPISIKI